jgi:UDP-3-O-[3-hydroxymyristoyl] N-acetylglucosamine deacetylase
MGFNKPTESFVLTEPVSYINGKTHVVVIPSDKFNVSYSVNFNHPELNHRWVSLEQDKLNEIVQARTFGYLKELEMLQAAGYARGVSIENTVGLTDDGYTTELYSQYEPAKHKILDLIGDFYLTGFNPLDLKAEVIAKEAGHAVHVSVAKILKDKIIREN